MVEKSKRRFPRRSVSLSPPLDCESPPGFVFRSIWNGGGGGEGSFSVQIVSYPSKSVQHDGKSFGNSVVPSMVVRGGKQIVAVCGSCQKSPSIIERHPECKCPLCIECATRFERVRRRCTLCQRIPTTEERNRRHCTKCKGIMECFF